MSMLIKELRSVAGLEVLCDEPMSRHTSFRIGGPADLYLRPHTEHALIQAVRLVRESGTPLTISVPTMLRTTFAHAEVSLCESEKTSIRKICTPFTRILQL